MGHFLESILQQLSSSLGLFMLSLVIIEWIVLVISKSMRSNKEGFVNLLSYGLASIPFLFLSLIFIFGTMFWFYEHRLFTLGFHWYVWVAAYVLHDFMFYIMHYLGHQTRFFWCIHGVHHTAEEMKLTVAVRGSFLDILYVPMTYLFLPILGFDPLLVYITYSFSAFWGLIEHVNEKFVGKQPLLEKFLVTPSVHRIHHAKNHIYLDRNYGETFSVWDRIFGTFQTELSSEKPEYGLMNSTINSESLWQVQLILWRDLFRDVKNTPKWSNKLKYFIKPPGWNPEDGGKLSTAYREEAWQRKYQKEEKYTATPTHEMIDKKEVLEPVE